MKSRKPRPCLSPLASTQTRAIGDGFARSDTIPQLESFPRVSLMVHYGLSYQTDPRRSLGLYIVSWLCRRQMRVFRFSNHTHLSHPGIVKPTVSGPCSLEMVCYLELGLFCFFHQYGVRWILWFSEINVMVSSLGGHANVLQQKLAFPFRTPHVFTLCLASWHGSVSSRMRGLLVGSLSRAARLDADVL